MASIGTPPKTWIPYIKGKDCSQGFCSLYCPQWCYIIFPPPPPPAFDDFPNDNSSPTFSPLVIGIIGTLVSAFLLVSYYTIISKYWGNNNNNSDSSIIREDNQDEFEELEDNHNPSLHEPWHVTTTGLDEALIKSITMCKYKKGDGLIESTDCSVCLSEFQEDECVRLLPKCSHAFHVSCIDTWLKSHSNCPLCRANIVFVGSSLPILPLPLPPPPPPPLMERILGSGSLQGTRIPNANIDIERQRVVSEDERVQNHGAPRTPLRVHSDLRRLEYRDTVIEMRDENERYHQHIRRSFSMDHPFQSRNSIADMLRVNQEEEFSSEIAGSSKQAGKSSHRRKRVLLHGVLSPVSMKRSFSSGRFFLPRHGRVHDTISTV